MAAGDMRVAVALRLRGNYGNYGNYGIYRNYERENGAAWGAWRGRKYAAGYNKTN